MKRAILLLLIFAGIAWAQEPEAAPALSNEHVRPKLNLPPTSVMAQTQTEHATKATYTDVNCSGFISNQPVTRTNRVGGGWHTPHTTKFTEGSTIYLEGTGYKENDQVYLIRELVDPNRYELYEGQRKLVAKTGQPFADVGRARVIALRGKVAIAKVEFSCEQIVPGDLVISYYDRPQVNYTAHASFDRFPAYSHKAEGRIVLARDFDLFLSTGRKVYLNVGGNQGVKPGDVFRAMRGYLPSEMDAADALSFKASTTEDTQKNQLSADNKRLAELPRRALGELVVLNVTPTSSTAMITFALEDIHVGDPVEMMESAAQ